jgi:putative transcriptional regulator
MTSEAMESIDTLLARYVAGSLPAPAHMLVAAHLEIKQDNRAFVRGLEGMAGEALETEAPIAIGQRDRRLAAIFDAPPPPRIETPYGDTGIFPRVLRDFVGFDAGETPWRTKMPGFREFDVGEVDGCHVSLFWIRPGRRIPTHTHGGAELTLVLDGAFTDIAGRYGRGDISIADENVEHRPTAEKDRPCIGLAVTDAPLRLSGPIGQRLLDIISG